MKVKVLILCLLVGYIIPLTNNAMAQFAPCWYLRPPSCKDNAFEYGVGYYEPKKETRNFAEARAWKDFKFRTEGVVIDDRDVTFKDIEEKGLENAKIGSNPIQCTPVRNTDPNAEMAYVLILFSKNIGKNSPKYPEELLCDDELPPPPKKYWYDYVPVLGIKQIGHQKYGTGIPCLVVEVGGIGCLIGGVSLQKQANSLYSDYENLKAKTLTEHNNLYDKYKSKQRGADWCKGIAIFAGSVLIADIIYSCIGVQKKTISVTPTTTIDHQGNFGMGMNVNIKF